MWKVEGRTEEEGVAFKVCEVGFGSACHVCQYDMR